MCKFSVEEMMVSLLETQVHMDFLKILKLFSLFYNFLIIKVQFYFDFLLLFFFLKFMTLLFSVLFLLPQTFCVVFSMSKLI